jgi:excisionase family DNA binding protein
MSAVDRPPPPRIALSVEEACQSLGCSWDFFAEHVAPSLRVVRRGRRKLIAVEELQRWMRDNAEGLLS